MSARLPPDPLATVSFAQFAQDLRAGRVSASSLAETYLASGGDGIAGAFGTLGERAP